MDNNSEQHKISTYEFLNKYLIFIIIAIVSLIHIALLCITFNIPVIKKEIKDPTVFKIFDVTEYSRPKDSNTIEIAKQEKITEDVIETDKQIKELDVDYMPMHLISEAPIFPEKLIESKIEYPILAFKQGIEGSVILELYIDKEGNIDDIKILKDPGYGFAEAAIKAIKSVKCIPAKSNGIPIPVKFRKPIRFVIKK